ncbi:MAG: NAD(P)-dependent oxidoreductase [Planctomycetia bacterium]|nr:NAD(P)-dependent oxidoreductase [Planctomycetia bacterium]
MKIAWIGTGIMGAAMCGRLLEAGHECVVFNRTESKARVLLEKGARWASSPAAAGEDAEAIFTMVGFPHDLEETIFHPERGVLAGQKDAPHRAKFLVDMTTSRPALARRIAEAAAILGIQALDAPVSGGDVGAKNGSLSIMVGGETDAFEALAPLWNVLGKTIVHQGPSGAGQHAKMVNQILIAGNMMGVCEALRYALAAGLEPEKVLESVSTGAAGSWSLSNLGPRILRHDFEPGFKIRHFLKDLRIALEEAEAFGSGAGLYLPGTQKARELYDLLERNGLGEKGTQALFLWEDQKKI